MSPNRVITAESAGDAEREINNLTGNIIGAAIEVHRTLGPGLLESTYEECLLFELIAGGISVERQKALPVIYKNINLSFGLGFLIIR